MSSNKRFQMKECQQLRHILETKKDTKKKRKSEVKSAEERSRLLSSRAHSRVFESRFRTINEFLYSHSSSEVNSYMTCDVFNAYHRTYESIANKWPQKPINYIIERLGSLISSSSVVADIGCGCRPLVKEAFPHNTVHSFDLVSNGDERITEANMTSLPLSDQSLDFALFSLSLMNTDLNQCFLETNRVLKDEAILIVVEVVSRFQQNIQTFCQQLSRFGFKLALKQYLPPNEYFVYMQFRKKSSVAKKDRRSLPQLTLKPCLYKKR